MKQLKNITASTLFHDKSGVLFPVNTYVTIDEDRLSLFVDSQMETWLTSTSPVYMEFYDGVTIWSATQETYDRFINPADEIDYREVTFEPTGFPLTNGLNSTCNISFTNGTRTFSISPVSTNFYYYIRGKKYIKTSTENVVITNTTGNWYIYYSGTTLTASQTPWKFTDPYAFIAIIYWDSVLGTSFPIAEERHGLVMDWASHQRFHRMGAIVEPDGFQLGNYILTGNGTSNTHATISLTNGVLNDEDIIMPITHNNTPTLAFEQILTPIAKIPILYLSWEPTISQNVWKRISATDYPIAGNSPNTAFYNFYNTGNGQWSRVNTTSGYYIAMWIAVSNFRTDPIIAVMGQAQSSSLFTANNDNLFERLYKTGLPTQEYKFIYRLIFQTSTTYTNAVKSALRSFFDVGNIYPVSSGVVPPFVFSKDGGVSVGTYLRTGAVQTDRSGQPIKGLNYVVEISATNLNQVASNTVIQFTRRTGRTTRTDITDLTVTIPAGTYFGTRTGISISIGPDWEIGCYNKSGSSLSDAVAILYLIAQ